MRELCNLSYALQVQHLDADELRDFDRKLVAEPGKVVRTSRGTDALQAMMRGGGGRSS